MNEFDRIAAFFAPLAAKAEGAFGLADDAAVVTPPPGEMLVVTQDTLVESIHFVGDELPAQIAQKSLRVNLSDLAAKGARPLGYFLSLSLPARCGETWIAEFCEGLAADQERYSITLMGGDSTSSPDHIVITITAIGAAPHMVRRASARAGDTVFVTGTIGDAALGLHHRDDAFLYGRYCLPQPRVAFASAIRSYASAALDVSDGLLQDARHLATQSGVCLELVLDNLPLSDAAACHVTDISSLLSLASGGDDYEILFTAPAEKEAEIRQMADAAGIRITAIGYCANGEGINLTYAGDLVELPKKLGYSHSL